ncbi:hypothetical protein CBA19C6_15270 [Cupriavidus pauculus]|nr:hypothetical protein CBA19C6_15270 [Cupriavidus pauculus]
MTRLSKHLSVCLAAAVLCGVIPASQAKDWPDPLLETAGTPENVAKGNEYDAYQLGLAAYVWGYPLVRMERVAREYTDVPNPKPSTSYRAPLNQIGWARDLATPSALDMPTANNDTTYLSAMVDLSREPYILSFRTLAAATTWWTPSTCGRSWSTTLAAA